MSTAGRDFLRIHGPRTTLIKAPAPFFIVSRYVRLHASSGAGMMNQGRKITITLAKQQARYLDTDD
jgi:hypothetical protein